MGIVGLPNVGKSTTFNLLCGMEVTIIHLHHLRTLLCLFFHSPFGDCDPDLSLLTTLSQYRKVDAENYPFCTIDPSVSRVALPDERYNWLCEKYQPANEVPAYLSVTDIAG